MDSISNIFFLMKFWAQLPFMETVIDSLLKYTKAICIYYRSFIHSRAKNSTKKTIDIVILVTEYKNISFIAVVQTLYGTMPAWAIKINLQF